MITIYFDIQKAAHAEMRFNTLYSAKSLYSAKAPCGAKALYIVKTPRSAIAPTAAKALYSATTYNYIKMKKRNVYNESTCVHCIVNVVGSLHQLSLMNIYVNILDLNQNAPFDVKAVLKNRKRILRRKQNYHKQMFCKVKAATS